MRVLLCLLLFCYDSYLNAQHSILSTTVSTQSRGLANAGICNWNPQSGYMNTAHLGFLQYHSFNIDAHNYFFLTDLYTLTSYGAWNLDQHSGLGFSISSDGSSDLREWMMAVSYGRKLSENTSIGISLDYLHIQTPESEDLKNFCFELGFQTKLLPSLLVGMMIKNPVPINTNTLYPFPSLYKFGLNYKVYDQLQILFELHKYGKQTASFLFGINYFPIDMLSFTAGMNTTGPLFSFGINYSLENKISLHIAMQQHVVLGTSPSFGFSYNFR